jgi:hypothetical protein
MRIQKPDSLEFDTTLNIYLSIFQTEFPPASGLTCLYKGDGRGWIRAKAGTWLKTSACLLDATFRRHEDSTSLAIFMAKGLAI